MNEAIDSICKPWRGGPCGLWRRSFVSNEGGGFAHRTVMRDEAVAALAPRPGAVMLDLTLGGGGHSEALLAAGARVIAVDRDPQARAAAAARLARFGERLTILAGNFADFPALLEARGDGPVDGILMDLGVSSPQLDDGARGFSFLRDGGLDMRMDPESGRPASDLVNEAGEGELVRIFREFGEEPQARRAARAIVAARARQPILRTARLAEVIEAALGRRSGKHPATRIFQALRIAVNGELDALERALEAAAHWLNPGGVLAVISFHSLEDRMVKRFLAATSAATLDRPEWPEPRQNPRCFFDRPRRIRPSEAELLANPRARSACLRVAERRAAP